jgi:hypothetical protein
MLTRVADGIASKRHFKKHQKMVRRVSIEICTFEETLAVRRVFFGIQLFAKKYKYLVDHCFASDLNPSPLRASAISMLSPSLEA